MAVTAKSEADPPCAEKVQKAGRRFLSLGTASILFVAFRGLSHGVAEGNREDSGVPPLCDQWHRGGGEGEAIDLGQLERNYAQLRERLSGSLRRDLEHAVGRVQSPGYDLGLRACRGADVRRARPEREVPGELRGKTLWFFRLDGGKIPTLPAMVSADPGALLFAVRTDSLGALGTASRVLGRPVSLAPRGLAEALGVRCVPAQVSISKQGEVEIHENP